MKTVVLGEQVVVEAAENPSTGYLWQVQELPNEEIAKFVSNEFVEPDASEPGTPGKRLVTFECVGKGMQKILMAHVRN